MNSLLPTRETFEVTGRLPRPEMEPLPAPEYRGEGIDCRRRMALAVESMKEHTTNEGWEIMAGLQSNGYCLAGYNLRPYDCTDVEALLHANPAVVFVQDKREWDVRPGDFREPRARFSNLHLLASRPDVFTGTILKDAHQRPDYHRASANEMGAHFWVVYYDKDIVSHLAPYVRPQHVIRTYHTVDRLAVPAYSAKDRRPAILSGAVSGVYPLRHRLVLGYTCGEMPLVHYHRHPGYHRRGSSTPAFLNLLSGFKVAICTSSVFGYALRKIIEATACGCRVITDLPSDEVLPDIDRNLYRISSHANPSDVNALVEHLARTYDDDEQAALALAARRRYDYREMTRRLCEDIENLRLRYDQTKETTT